jgi:hypothetical protein
MCALGIVCFFRMADQGIGKCDRYGADTQVHHAYIKEARLVNVARLAIEVTLQMINVITHFW